MLLFQKLLGSKHVFISKLSFWEYLIFPWEKNRIFSRVWIQKILFSRNYCFLGHTTFFRVLGNEHSRGNFTCPRVFWYFPLRKTENFLFCILSKLLRLKLLMRMSPNSETRFKNLAAAFDARLLKCIRQFWYIVH